MGWSRPDEEHRADHAQDHAKHDTPAHRFDKPPTTALEIARLVKAVDLAMGTRLIEQYGKTCASEGRLDGANRAYERTVAAIESPLTPANYGGE